MELQARPPLERLQEPDEGDQEKEAANHGVAHQPPQPPLLLLGERDGAPAREGARQLGVRHVAHRLPQPSQLLRSLVAVREPSVEAFGGAMLHHMRQPPAPRQRVLAFALPTPQSARQICVHQVLHCAADVCQGLPSPMPRVRPVGHALGQLTALQAADSGSQRAYCVDVCLPRGKAAHVLLSPKVGERLCHQGATLVVVVLGCLRGSGAAVAATARLLLAAVILRCCSRRCSPRELAQPPPPVWGPFRHGLFQFFAFIHTPTIEKRAGFHTRMTCMQSPQLQAHGHAQTGNDTESPKKLTPPTYIVLGFLCWGAPPPRPPPRLPYHLLRAAEAGKVGIQQDAAEARDRTAVQRLRQARRGPLLQGPLLWRWTSTR